MNVINGVPKPERIFTMENTANNDFISEIHVSNDFCVSLNSRSFVHIHQLPNFQIIKQKQLSSVVTFYINENNNIIVLHSTRPMIFDYNFEIINGSMKRPNFQNHLERYQFLASDSFDNLLVAGTSNSGLCLWDIRSSSTPNVLTLKRSYRIQSVLLNRDIIIVGCEDGTISIFDPRNMNKKVDSFDIFNDLITTKIKTKPFYSLIKDKEEPWRIGFQFSYGYSGTFDLMNKKIIRIINAPESNVNEQKFIKPKPIFYGDNLCVGYPFSNIIQSVNLNDNSIKEIKLENAPISFDYNCNYDGLFVCTSCGDIYNVR